MPEYTESSWEEIKGLVAAAKHCQIAMFGFSAEQRHELAEVARAHGTEIEWLIDKSQMYGMPDA